MTTVPYEIVDVFTDRPFAGNPLAVVFGAELLGTDQMAALAREFNLSETVFVLPPSAAAPDATYRARIFTPTHELPFAGHPSVGAAVTVTRRGLAAPGPLRQECGAGVLPIEVTAHGEATLTGGTPTLGPERDPAPLLEITGLTAADLAGHPPRTAGCGLEFTYLPVRPGAPARITLDAAAAARHDVTDVVVFAWDAATGRAHVRVFCPGLGVPEDPATGSAALGLGVWLTAAGLLPADGTARYTVHQGAEIHRPSTLECSVTAAAGTAVSATVAGHVIEIAKGEITVPPFLG
ncbi:trans-2,3-dihydro-3-hydroxyanthranilate isomerase [Catenuloplanes nepalensis]|uniref:Trans-2,3-dihydro-3-hydroxyanthranilate isomerase n=1 Tax=Catenuloplanes nepalensis TaxID=587533 RepID=A0ABT9N2P0_9ACTN|nr:PhzF family phenazine biosynthesis protein [Catenuloplanes nepalensis]MDP9797953.1 trans-2,3-dihydro-3-hydroxyanthranilate isomerase [Catenuloplanes nepalensis]